MLAILAGDQSLEIHACLPILRFRLPRKSGCWETAQPCRSPPARYCVAGRAHRDDEAIGSVIANDVAAVPDSLLVLGTSLRVHGPRRQGAVGIRSWVDLQRRMQPPLTPAFGNANVFDTVPDTGQKYVEWYAAGE